MKTIFVDFDGVLHPSTAILGRDMTALAIQGGDKLLEAGFFCWTHLLEDALSGAPHEDIALVVHSSWRGQRWLSNALLQTVLGPLAHRFAGCVGKEEPREKAIADFVGRMSLEDYLILDDATSEFPQLKDRLVSTNPLQGINDETLREKIRAWAAISTPSISTPKQVARLAA